MSGISGEIILIYGFCHLTFIAIIIYVIKKITLFVRFNKCSISHS